MRITLWGTRGSLAAPGPETVRYGGNTSCVEVRGAGGECVVLDAGTGIRRLGAALPRDVERIDLLLTHLHMDHIQGLGFFAPLYEADRDVHIWGPPSMMLDLRTRLSRYLSPPLFPVRLRDVECRLTLHHVPLDPFRLGNLTVTAELVCHPGLTLGYRLAEDGASMAYLSDHEPALGVDAFPGPPIWTSGFDLAAGVDLLIHDAQFAEAEYPEHIGWGHSTVAHALQFAAAVNAKRLVTFHHDPAHDDDAVDDLTDAACQSIEPDVEVVPGAEGAVFELGA
jgi:phosphoribosyl 1,2-cyclic phosphodiesterase